MKRNRNDRDTRRPAGRGPITFSLSGIEDAAAFAESADVDVAGDKAWFDKHPSANIRMRPISPREVKASGRPAGTPVTVVRRPGMLVRLIGNLNTSQPGGDSLPLPPAVPRPVPRNSASPPSADGRLEKQQHKE
jgi:hypothetical protein